MKTIVMTGATNGLGEAAARQMAAQGHRMILIARDKARGEATLASLPNANGDITHRLYLADMSSLTDLKRVAADIRKAEPNIDVLVNNAGGTFGTRQTAEGSGLEKTLAVNHLAYFVLTLELQEPLMRGQGGSRVVNTASFTHRRRGWDPDDIDLAKTGGSSPSVKYSGLLAYYRSKLYNILFTRELARRWAEAGVTVNCVDPGLVATNFGAGQLGLFEPALKLYIKLFGQTAEQGGAKITYLATDEGPAVRGVTGKYFAKNVVEETTPDSRNDEYARVLWDKSLEWAKMK